MTGVGHFMMLEDPEGFNALLENVIRRLEAEQREKG
jgi:pimeloyl-ACP methyl ester carboxylesterase